VKQGRKTAQESRGKIFGGRGGGPQAFWGRIRESFRCWLFLAELGSHPSSATIALANAPAFSFAGLLAGTLAGPRAV